MKQQNFIKEALNTYVINTVKTESHVDRKFYHSSLKTLVMIYLKTVYFVLLSDIETNIISGKYR